ncbi:MAG: hypothetical protein ACI9O6_003343 [Glaciecola sp.]
MLGLDKIRAQFKAYLSDKDKRNDLLITLFIIFLLVEDSSIELLFKYLVFGFVIVSCDLLSTKYLKLDRKGPLPWYASPVLWVGVPAIVFMVYVFSW